MRPKDVVPFLVKMAEAGNSVLLESEPGIGKTSLVEQSCKAGKRELLYIDAGTSDNTRAEGMPWINPAEEEARFFPFGEIARALKATEPTTLCIDDLGWAMISVQNSFAHVIHERRLPNGQRLPDNVAIVATTNRRTDRAGVAGLSEPVKSRFTSIVHVEANTEDWCAHVFDHFQDYGLTEEAAIDGVSFIRFRPELLHKFQPSADLSNSPSPRTVVNALKICSLGLPAHQEYAGVAGAAGEGWATEFMGFRRLRAELPPLDSIILNPDQAPIPANPSALWAVAIGLAAKVTVKNFARVSRYAERLYESMHGEFATVLIKEATRTNPAITNTNAFIQLMTGEMGKLINGES